MKPIEIHGLGQAALAACLVLSGAGAIAAQPATAQDGAAVDMTGMGIYGMEDAVMDAARGGNRSTKKTAPKPIVLTFRPSLQRRRANLAKYVQQAKQKDPSAGDSLEAVFAKGDFIERIQGELNRYGLRVNNVADAYAVWWVVMWRAANQRSDDPSRAQLQAVKAQTARALASLPTFAKATDTTKQQIAEVLLVQAALVDGAIDKAKSSPSERQSLAESAKQSANANGLRVQSMSLTPKGFVAKNGGSAR